MDCSYLEKNLELVKNKMKNAALAANRDGGEILLMPAVKYADAEQINYLHTHLGINDVGENRVQQLLERWDKLEKDGLNIHFIGSLQTNKVKYIIDKVCLIHSLDSERLAAEIDRQAKKHGIVMRVLVEVNSGSEESKGGIEPSEVERFCLSLDKYEGIKLCGFMTMAPRCEDKSLYHKYFSQTRDLCTDIWYNKLKRSDDPILSMGMSESFEEAIAEGSTLVRVGSMLFRQNNT